MSKMSYHLEQYKKYREELEKKIGRYVLGKTGVLSLDEFKINFVVLNRLDDDVQEMLRLSEKEFDGWKVVPASDEMKKVAAMFSSDSSEISETNELI